MFNKVAFIGLGLIGGSLARRIREVFPNTTISAIARSKETINFALANNIIDETSSDLELVVNNAKLIIIATPLELIAEYTQKIIPYILPETIIIDIGSTKNKICQSLKKYYKNFIGGHPMFGLEKTGIQNSAALLANNAVFALTPYPKTPKNKLTILQDFITALKMRPLVIRPEVHDEAVAAISHLPYFVAATLLHNATTPTAKNLAATGFQSTTRVGEADPNWGIEIAKTNKSAILKQINVFQKNLQQIKKLITQEKFTKLLSILKKSQGLRRSIYP